MTEVKGDPQGADNPNKEDFQSPSQKRKQGTTDFLFVLELIKRNRENILVNATVK